jgi:putative glutamine amidotransferase
VNRPLIGVTTSELRRQETVAPTPEGEPGQTEMALGLKYLEAVERAGGIPVVLPPLRGPAIPSLLANLSGLLLSGGPDLDPIAYGALGHAMLGPTEPSLDAFEVALARAADRRGIPILGICRGAQALNVARGGTLHQHLPDITDGTVAHRQTAPGHHTCHEVRIVTGSLLADVTGGSRLAVNSFHHQAIDRLGRGLVPVAWARDGTIEAVEAVGRSLLLGVQWHAETLVGQRRHRALFKWLVLAARAHATGTAALVLAAAPDLAEPTARADAA